MRSAHGQGRAPGAHQTGRDLKRARRKGGSVGGMPFDKNNSAQTGAAFSAPFHAPANAKGVAAGTAARSG